MKKKLLIAAAITVAVLLIGTIVGFAIDSANRRAEQTAEALAKEQAEKELRVQVVLEKLQISPDSEAGAVLVEILNKKEMTERDMAIYSEMSEEIRKMDYEAVSAKLQEYSDVEQTLTEISWQEAMADEDFRQRVAQMLIYKEYAQAIATGEELYEQNHKALSDYYINGKRMAEEKLERIEKQISENPERAQYVQREIFVRKQFVKISVLAGDMLEIFEQDKASGKDIDQINQDMQDLIDYMGSEKRLYNNTNINVSHDYSFIISRHLDGESIKQIVG